MGSVSIFVLLGFLEWHSLQLGMCSKVVVVRRGGRWRNRTCRFLCLGRERLLELLPSLGCGVCDMLVCDFEKEDC